MADFNYTPVQYPDLLRSAALGQGMAINSAMAPGALAEQQQGLQAGALNLQQIQMAMRFQQMKQSILGQALGAQSTQTGQQSGGGDGGIQNGPQGSVSATPNYGYQPSGLSQESRRAIGMLAPEMLKGYDEGDASALKSAQVRSQLPGSPLSVYQAFATNSQAGDALTQQGNEALLSQWPALARKYGLDPKNMSNINVQMAATMAANEQRRALQLPPLPMPTGYKDVEGPYGQHFQVQVGGETPGKETEVVGQKPPTYTPEIGVNPKTGQKSATLLQTAPGGLPVPSALSGNAPTKAGPQGGGVGQVVGQPQDVGYAAPTTENFKGAQFADYFKTGAAGVNKLEMGGYTPTTKARSIMIGAATSEKDGLTSEFLMQLAVKNGLSAKDKEYMAAAFPMLEAIGHDLAGARLPPPAIRMKFESVIPTDSTNSADMAQVRANRASFLRGLSAQSGVAGALPQYAGRNLGVEDKSTTGTAPASALAHLKAHPELAPQFKAKYGYLPGG